MAVIVGWCHIIKTALSCLLDSQQPCDQCVGSVAVAAVTEVKVHKCSE